MLNGDEVGEAGRVVQPTFTSEAAPVERKIQAPSLAKTVQAANETDKAER